jgi:hypothetical protein
MRRALDLTGGMKNGSIPVTANRLTASAEAEKGSNSGDVGGKELVDHLKKYMVSVLIGVSAFVLMVSPASAWGPVTHSEIARQVAAQIKPAVASAFNAGCLIPDAALALRNQTGIQSMYHARAYFDELVKRANTPELQSFVQGYACHLASDGVESNYGKNTPVAVSGVDRMLGVRDSR